MRPALPFAFLLLPFLVACSASHSTTDGGGDTDGSVAVDGGTDGGGVPCGATVCAPGSFCCGRFGCFTGTSGCPPEPPPPDAGLPCGDRVCPDGEYCCNASCGICAAFGSSCIALACVDAGPPVRTCGTIAGLTCAADEYCDYGGDPTCGGDDGGGACHPRPTDCPDYVAPVCGCDHVTYANACDAEAAGVGVSTNGPCEMPPPPADCRTTGCGAGTSCQLCWAHYACIPSGAIC